MGRLFWKFFFSFFIVLIMVGAGVGTSVWVHQQEHEGPFKDLAGGPRVTLMIQLVEDILNKNDSSPFVSSMLDTFKNDRNIPHIYIVNKNNKELLNRPYPYSAYTHALQLINMHTEPAIARNITLKNGNEYTLFMPKVAYPYEGHRPPRNPFSPFFIPILFGGITSIICSAALAWYFTRSVRYLRNALNAVSKGNLDIRVNHLMKKQDDELADLGIHFDEMVQKIQQLLTSQQRLLHDVSHEIRSPLTRIQVAVGLLRQQPHRLEHELARIELEITHFNSLIDELLTLSRLENGIQKTSDECFDLISLLQEIIENVQFEFTANNQFTIINSDDEVLLRGSAKLIYRAIENIIKNAIKYTPSDSEITIQIECTANKTLVTISDTGNGIPENELETIFTPFIRGSMTQHHPNGYGLGLSIARRAVEAHGGTIVAKNKLGGGLSILITLPIFVM